MDIEPTNRAAISHQARRSTGPVTDQGKARSAQNARKHGFAGASVLIADEDRQAYQAHLDSYFESFQPTNQAECDQVRRIAGAQWRYDRLMAIETGLLDLALGAVSQDQLESHHRLAIAFQDLTNAAHTLELSRRYLNQASREIERAIRTFYLMRRNRPEPENPPAPSAPPGRKLVRLHWEPNELTPLPPPAGLPAEPPSKNPRKEDPNPPPDLS